jgi:hypothetical protein
MTKKQFNRMGIVILIILLVPPTAFVVTTYELKVQLFYHIAICICGLVLRKFVIEPIRSRLPENEGG